MPTAEDIILTVECCCDGQSVPVRRVMDYCGCTADQIIRLVKAGKLVAGPLRPQIVHGLGTFRHPLDRMTVKPVDYI